MSSCHAWPTPSPTRTSSRGVRWRVCANAAPKASPTNTTTSAPTTTIIWPVATVRSCPCPPAARRMSSAATGSSLPSVVSRTSAGLPTRRSSSAPRPYYAMETNSSPTTVAPSIRHRIVHMARPACLGMNTEPCSSSTGTTTHRTCTPLRACSLLVAASRASSSHTSQKSSACQFSSKFMINMMLKTHHNIRLRFRPQSVMRWFLKLRN